MGFLDRLRPERDATAAVSDPAWTPYEIWGQRGWPSVDIVGESFHGDAIRALLPTVGGAGNEVNVPVFLRHEADNPHDRNAVEVRAATGQLGYLGRDDAARYAATIAAFHQRGLVPTTLARVWGREDEDWNTGKPRFFGSVRIDLPEPHMLAPVNAPPAVQHLLLPAGAAMQVTGEDANMGAIAPHLRPAGESWVYATLCETVEEGARVAKRLAEVRIDGRPVGRLSPKMSGDVLPAVQFLAERGLATGVRAIVKGNRLRAEVVVYAARAHQLPPDWFGVVHATQPTAPAAEATPQLSPPLVGVRAHPEQPSALNAPPPAAPDGWYPDPYAGARLRRWDGRGWTHETRA